jgi:hypothetical protein
VSRRKGRRAIPTSASSRARSRACSRTASSARASPTRRPRSPTRRSAPTTRAPPSCTSTPATTTARRPSRPRCSRDQGGGRGALPHHPQLLDRHDPRRRDSSSARTSARCPEIAALNMGTMNYSKYSAKRKAFDFDMVFSNTYEKIIKLLTAMNEAGVKPELECFDTGHTHGHLAAPRHGRAEAAAPVLVHRERARRHPRTTSSRSSSRRRSCPPGSEWEVIGSATATGA